MALENVFGDLALDATVAAIVAAVDQLEGFTDDIEPLLTTIAAAVADLDGNTDDIETLLTAIAASVAGLDGNTDDIETLLTTLSTTVLTDTQLRATPVPVSGTITATDAAQKAEDTAAASGDLGNPILGVRNDAATAQTSADGDYGMVALDSAGRVGITDLGGSITVDGTVAVSNPGLTDAQLRATAVPVTDTALTTTNSSLASILAAVDQLEDYTDGLEALLGTANTNTGTAVTTLASILAAVDQLEGYTDELETLIAATNTALGTVNTNLTTIDGRVDGLEALETAGNASLVSILAAVDQLEGFTDDIEPLITATNSALTTVNANLVTIDGRVDGLEALETAGNASLVSILAAVDQLEGYLDDVEGLLTTISTFGLTDTQLRASPVPTREERPSTGSVTSVPVSTTNATLLAANANRRGAIIHNEAGILFVKFGATASSTSYTYRLTANQVLELPHPCYTGRIDAIKSTGSSDALVTELT